MVFNTDIDFISSSGGVLQDISHIEFIPLGSEFLPDGTSPDLPSGGLWLRPNDGQVERLNYQGTSGIFDARNTEGYAAYTTTTTAAFGFGSISFETVVFEDAAFINQDDATHWRIHVEGLWRITYAARFNTPTGGSPGTMRATLAQTEPTKNLFKTRCEQFVADDGDQGGGCVYANAMILIPRGARIRLDLLALGGLSTDLVEAMITFALIRPDSQDPQ